MAHAFISYTRRDQDWVDVLVATLARAGVSYWMDRNDLPVTVAWAEELRAAIQESDFFIQCASDDYERSKHCQWELATANELGKQVLTLNITGEDVRLAAARIAAVVGQCPPDVRAHTELLTRSAAWERADRDKGMLISGDPLRMARRLAAHRTLKFPPVTIDFVQASRRRQRWFRRWTAVGVTIVTLAGLLVVISGLMQSTFRKTTEDNLKRFAALNREPDQDIYRELTIASTEASNAGFAFLSRMPLVRALSTPIPERSYVVPGAPLTGFTTDVVRGTEPPISRVPNGPIAVPKLAETPSGEVADLVTSPDKAYLAASYSNDGIVRVFSNPSLTVAATMVVPTTSSRLAFSVDGRLLAVGVGPDVWIHDVRTAMPLGQLRGSVGTIRDLAWSADGSEVWAVAGDNRVSGWRWRSGQVLIDDPSLWFVSVAGPAGNGEFAVITRDGRIYRVSGTSINEVRTSAREAVSAAISHDASQVAIGTQDSVVVRDPAGEHQIALETCVPTGLSFAPDGRRLYVACFNEPEVRAYDPGTSKLVGSAKLVNTGASSVTTDAKGTVFTGTSFGEVIELSPDLTAQRFVLHTTCDVPVRAVKSNVDGTVIAQTGDGGGKSRCMTSASLKNGRWDPTNQVLATETGEQGRAVGLTADGTLAASGYSDGTVAFWTPDAETPSGGYRDFGGEVRGIAFTPDNTKVLVASRDGILELMDACRLCRPTPDLIAMAGERLTYARQLGLTG